MRALSHVTTSVQRLHREVKALIRLSTVPMPRRNAEALERDIDKAVAALAAAPATSADELDAKLACLIWRLRRHMQADPESLVPLALAVSIREDLRLFWSGFDQPSAPHERI